MQIQLDEQIAFLKTSLANWQENETEAKRMSVALRVLFHDTQRSQSISQQMGTKGTLKFPDTKSPKDAFAFWNISGQVKFEVGGDSANWPYHGLVAKTMRAEGDEVTLEFNPLYLHPSFKVDRHFTISFTDWWEGEVFEDSQGSSLSRKDLVLIAANKDGGAHVDPGGLPLKYEKFKDTDLLKIKNAANTPAPFSTIPAYAAIAQIAYEALVALGHTHQA